MSGEKKGKVDKLVEHLPGLPDNIRYDGEGNYWIGLPMVLPISLLQFHWHGCYNIVC